ncbi:hypothetical protein ElyMa_000460600 [Elysia marginata]|uniref:Transmembrane protein n=1 Tax=Elysia marginata TaxID=1093978 RepID=A0AAV4FRB1_9GAST|nr:hypothetical protein ElyMa_000460600 [Elysia marginata]
MYRHNGLNSTTLGSVQTSLKFGTLNTGLERNKNIRVCRLKKRKRVKRGEDGVMRKQSLIVRGRSVVTRTSEKRDSKIDTALPNYQNACHIRFVTHRPVLLLLSFSSSTFFFLFFKSNPFFKLWFLGRG